MGDVFLCLVERVGLLKSAPQHLGARDPAVPRVDPPVGAEIEPDEIEEIVKCAVLDGQGSVHIGFRCL